MPLVERGRRGIHYESVGDPTRPPVLLIMGLGFSSRAWDRLPALLARDFHVLVFDNLGTGRSGRVGFAYRMRDLADDAAAVIDAAGVRSAHVFGISMGGMIAQELAIGHPGRVRSLALGCTFASWRARAAPPLGTKLDLVLLNLGLVTPSRISRVLVSAEWHAAHPESALRWMKRAERTALRYATAQVLAIARHERCPGCTRSARRRWCSPEVPTSWCRPRTRKCWRAASPARASWCSPMPGTSSHWSGKPKRCPPCASTFSRTDCSCRLPDVRFVRLKREPDRLDGVLDRPARALHGHFIPG
jgi:pimeloyl-ACP methyl ester carboxylesterase